jgi:hypothetical protein
MRLIDVRDFSLHTFYGDATPPYAILSHTWLQADEEVTFAAITDVTNTAWRRLPGAQKIIFTCKQAAVHGLRYAWIDTCCIDKSNSVELSEAINSMFRWYQQSVKCYVYLTDVREHTDTQIARSWWWSRAWTLQELVAPRVVIFYDMNGQKIGTKADLTELIASRFNIDCETLEHPHTIFVKSVAQRMSWAAHRKATRIEDQAYSLLGIFEVNMTMQYGEGMLAFTRLQEMILQKSNDQTLFTWGLNAHPIEETLEAFRRENGERIHTRYRTDGDVLAWHENGMFADNPAQFAETGGVIFHSAHALTSHVGEVNGALRMDLFIGTILECPKLRLSESPFIDSGRYLCILPCGHVEYPASLVAVLLEQWVTGRFRRVEIMPDVYTFLVDCHTISKLEECPVWIDNHVWISRHKHALSQTSKLHRTVRIKLEVPAEDYEFIVVSKYWAFDQHNLVLERYHPPKEPAFLEVGLYRRKLSDVSTITIRLSIWKESDSELMRDKIGIINKDDIDKGPWIKDDEFDAEDVGRSASLYDIHVDVETQQVYNHLISSVKIRYIPPPQPEVPHVSDAHDGDVSSPIPGTDT